MILFEILGTEDHPAYRAIEVANGARQYDFLRTIVETAPAVGRPFLSQQLIKALNFHAIVCLHTNAGEYRPCPVVVGGTYHPPAHYRVQALMDDFVNTVNRVWKESDSVALAAYVLWQLNLIHPFINGNGRTARAASYFVLCTHLGHWLPGNTILPELLRRDHAEYVAALKAADAAALAGQRDLSVLHALLERLLDEQINGPAAAAPQPGDADAAAAPEPEPDPA